MMNLHRHFGTKQDFTNWLTTMWVFYVGNRILRFEDRIHLLPEVHRRTGQLTHEPLDHADAVRLASEAL